MTSEVCLEAAMALEAIGGNMHMNTRVIKVADFRMTSKAL